MPSAKPTDPQSLLRMAAPMLSWIASGIILAAGVADEVYKLRNRGLRDAQDGIESIRNLTWQDERLVCEACRRKGCFAEVVGSAAGDGGVDVVLTRAGERVLVRCRQWKAWYCSHDC